MHLPGGCGGGLGGTGASVAVVCEDDPALVTAVGAVLAASGVRVIATVHRGADLLTVVAEHDPAVVVVDVALLGAQGVGLLARLREASAARLVALCPPGLDLFGLIEDADAVIPGDDLRPLSRLHAELPDGDGDGSGGSGGKRQGQLERGTCVHEVPAVRFGYATGDG
jgi:Response regulator receiver domain